MGRRRRARRRIERERAHRTTSRHAISLFNRIGLAVVGLALIVGGILLVTSGSPGNASRLGRIAGIAIILGLVAIGVAIIGHV